MKKLGLFIVWLIVATIGMSANAEVSTVTIDDIVYEVHVDEGYVVAKDCTSRSLAASYNGDYSRDMAVNLIFRDSVNNLPVTIIGDKFGAGYNIEHGAQMRLVTGKVKLPACLERIGNSAFGIKDYMEIDGTLPSSLVAIGNYAFGSTNRSMRMTIRNIPSGLKEIGQYSLAGCNVLGTCDLSGVEMNELPNGVFYDARVKKMILPVGLRSIGKYCFQSAAIESLKLPEELDNIGDRAFYGAEILDVKWPKTVSSVGGGAFTQIDLGTKGVLDMSGMNITSFGSGAMSGVKCGELVLPTSLLSIGEKCFSDADIEKVVLPKSLETIENYGFYESSIRDIEILSDLKSIGESVFKGSQVENVIINGNVTSIPSHAFYGCQFLTSIMLPESITSIGEFAFASCKSLKEINLDKLLNLHKLEHGTFGSCGLESVTLPESLDTIGRACFSGCSSLKEIIIGKNVREIGYYTFDNCNALRTVVCYAPNPPYLFPYASDASYPVPVNTFSKSTCEYGSLYVPQEAYERYKTNVNYWDYEKWFGLWGDFKQIVGFDGIHLSGIDGVVADADADDEPVRVYATSGVQVWQGLRGEMPELSPGIYVVRGVASARKIVVR